MLVKKKLKINIKINFQDSLCLDKFYMKISRKNPLGKIYIYDKFIHQYYCTQFNIPVSDIYMDYELHKNFFENCDSSYKLKLLLVLLMNLK